MREAPENSQPLIRANTENIHKYIRKYLSLDQQTQRIAEKFKYNLILSNLLDESLVPSKNEQAYSNLVQLEKDGKHWLPQAYAKEFGFDRSTLWVTEKRYRWEYVRHITSPLLLVNTISLVIFLLKQNCKISSELTHSSRLHMFRVLLVVSTQIMKTKRIIATIEAASSLRHLDQFMLANCKTNKVIIGATITLKEYDMFSYLNKELPNSKDQTEGFKKHLDTILSCLLLNVKHSIRELLPFANSEFLEKYCLINNLSMGSLFDTEPDTDPIPSFESLMAKLSIFNNHRRFLICQLLTVHDPTSHNFNTSKLCDHFKIDASKTKSYYSLSEKLQVLHRMFSDHNAMLEQLQRLHDKYQLLHYSAKSTDFMNDNILSTKVMGSELPLDGLIPLDSELDLNNLIDKLQNLTTSLKYFKKYSQSIASVRDADEYDEKLSIFALFSSELKAAQDLFKACMNNYTNDTRQPSPNPSSQSTSQRNSHNELFNPKSFHTSKKTTDEKAHKRMSSGLQLGLLTVVDKKGTRTSKRNSVVFEKATKCRMPVELPKTSSISASADDSFNIAALETISRKIGARNANRLSLYSTNSNVSDISDIMAFTQATSFNEEDAESELMYNAPMLSKEDLKQKLEANLDSLYGMNTPELRHMAMVSETTEETFDGELQDPKSKNPDFLGSLELKLTARTVDSC